MPTFCMGKPQGYTASKRQSQDSNPDSLRLKFLALIQGSANFLYKGPDCKYFRLHGPYIFCYSDSVLWFWHENSQRGFVGE